MLKTRIFQFNALGTNCVVSWADGSRRCTVFDPGMSSPEGIKDILEFMRKHGLEPDAILLTHGHFDHVWGVSALLEHFSVPVYMCADDKEILARGASLFNGMPTFKNLKVDFETVDVPEELSSGGVNWTVLRTPGHTPGGVCYYSPENNLLISGDTLFAGAIGRTDLIGGDYDILMKSLLEKVMLLPDDTDVIPGHGQPTSIGREATTNPFLQPFNEPLPDDE